MIQQSMDRFYKSQSSPATASVNSSVSLTIKPTMNDKNLSKKRRSLSLVKNSLRSPEKISKSDNHCSETRIKSEQEVIDLCSDDENTSPREDKNRNMSQNSSLSQASNSSQTTIIYDDKIPSTPKKPMPSSSKTIISPTSQKFFSPTKKRAVFKKTPVKRNLSKMDFGNDSRCSLLDDDFIVACDGMDDKSIFLLTIIKKCLSEYSLKDLLDENSVELLSNCFNIVKPGIRLVCRLYWRQRVWYRTEQLIKITRDKQEVMGHPQFMETINCLVQNGLVKPSADFGNNTLTFDDLVKLLKSEELKQICKELKLKIQSKQDSINALRSYSHQRSISNFFNQATTNNSKRVLDILKSKAGICYKLSDAACSALDKLHLLMYLGINYEAIREKKLELILINDKINRETYPVNKEMMLDNASIVFRSREEFVRYWEAHRIYEDYLKKVDAKEKICMIIKIHNLYQEIAEEDMIRYKSLPTWLRRYTPPHLYVKMLENGIQELKKDSAHHQLAVDILTTLISQIAFRQHKKADWYAEKALVLYKLMAKHDEAAEVLICGLQSSMHDEAKDGIRPRAHKLASQRNTRLAGGPHATLRALATDHLLLENTFPADHVRKQHMDTYTTKRGKKMFQVFTEECSKFLDAENFCILDYTTNGDFTHGEHWEGRIVTTIFHLLFWDIIYSKPRGVVGVFLSHYQLHPLDMYDESFYVNRKTLIEERLTKIENMSTSEMVEVMKAKWEERPESELSGINRSVGWDNVRMVCACLGSRAAAALCRRLATNYGYSHSGFPDLTLWNALTNKIKFVEVKTDTDKPSMKQLQWMRYLRAHDIDTGFCYVGAATERSRARAPPPSARQLSVKSVANINDTVRPRQSRSRCQPRAD